MSMVNWWSHFYVFFFGGSDKHHIEYKKNAKRVDGGKKSKIDCLIARARALTAEKWALIKSVLKHFVMLRKTMARSMRHK